MHSDELEELAEKMLKEKNKKKYQDNVTVWLCLSLPKRKKQTKILLKKTSSTFNENFWP